MGHYAALEDPAFLALWRTANERPIAWEEFCTLSMPEGADVRETWNAIELLREHAGCHLGHDPQGRTLWYNLPASSREVVRSIVERSSASSPLGRYCAGRPYGSLDIGAQLREIAHAVELDGADPDYELLRGLLLHEREARSPLEHIVCNYCAILEAERAGTSEAADANREVARLYGHLLEGVVPPETAQRSLNRTLVRNLGACLANAHRTSSLDVPGESAYIWGAAANLQIAGEHNALLGSLLRRVFLLRCGFEPLSLLPLSTVRPLHGIASDVDRTADILAYVQSMNRLLCRLEDLAADDEIRTKELVAALHRTPALNHRQSAILEDALTIPGVSFDFEALAARFQAAYNTVRADMAHLVNTGLLYSTNDGRKLTFHPVPDLRRALERLLVQPQG